MDWKPVQEVFSYNDGSLPDINFDFANTRVVADAYAVVQRQASVLTSVDAYYWSKSKQKECPISFRDNPAELVLRGEAEPFHVVFGGITSDAGHKIPDLGVFVLADDYLALDYRMGPEWSQEAIEGLFVLMERISSLAPCTITHTTNTHDPEGKILLDAFAEWKAAKTRAPAER
jgi:hypothetical protein